MAGTGKSSQKETPGNIIGGALFGPVRARPPAEIASLADCHYALSDFMERPAR